MVGTVGSAVGAGADLTLVGIVAFNTQVVQDDVDRVPTYVLLTPAWTRSAIATLGSPGALVYALQLDHGAPDVAAVEAEIKRAVPDATVVSITSIKVATAERAIQPESIALGVFGGIAVFAALLIAGQVIGRQLRLRAAELETFRALGADVAMTLSDGLVGIEGSILGGTLLALAVGFGLSPLSPLGPVRKVDPSPGFLFDWTALGLGALVLFVGLSASAWVIAFRGMPHRRARRSRRRLPGPSRRSTDACGEGRVLHDQPTCRCVFAGTGGVGGFGDCGLTVGGVLDRGPRVVRD